MSTISRRGFLSAAAVVAAVPALAACGSSSSSSSSKPLVIMADATPHTDILNEAVKLGLLGDVKLNIQTMTGEIDPNQLVESGDVDANFFQHVPYLNSWEKTKGVSDLVVVATTHVEPLGIYSKKVKSLSAVPNGSTVALAADPTNFSRGLLLLEAAGLITMKEKPTDKNLDYAQITAKDITANPKGLKFIQIDRPQLPASLDDPKVEISVINGANALQANLNPAKDALYRESATNNPFANVIVVKNTLKDDPRVKKLAEAVQSKQIQDWITSNYKGAVLPAKSA